MSEGPSPEQQDGDPPGAGRRPEAPNAGEASAAPQQGGEAAAGRACEQCGAPLNPDQNWCLQCGTGAGSASAGPGWRTAAAAIGASAVLALGAAAAAFAAFKEGSPPPASPSTVAQTPASTTPPAGTTPPAATTTTVTTTTATATATSTTGSAPPATSSKPPKIPAHEATPANGGTAGKQTSQDKTTPAGSGSKDESGKTNPGKGQSGAGTKDEEEACKTVTGTEFEEGTETSSTSSSSSSSSATTTTQTSSTDGEPSEKEECAAEKNTRGAKAAPISLKAEDASTYNPNAYPASSFTSPALAIDGIATTAWTAAPAFGLAPKVQAGLLLDLEGERRIAKVALISKTLGMTVQIYGTTQRKPPKSITAAGWQKLSGVHLVEERSSTISLRRLPKIRQLLVWVLRAPEVEPEVQGEAVEESAAIGEVALYEPK